MVANESTWERRSGVCWEWSIIYAAQKLTFSLVDVETRWGGTSVGCRVSGIGLRISSLRYNITHRSRH